MLSSSLNIAVIFLTVFWSMLSISLSSCSPKEPDPYSLEYEQFGSVEDQWESYSSGLTHVFDSLPTDSSAKPGIGILQAMKETLDGNIGWGLGEVSGTITALESGRKEYPWVVFLDPNHPWLLERGHTLSATQDSGMSFIFVRPDLVSRKWAGIFLIHELSHVTVNPVSDVVHDGQSELVASWLEAAAYNQLSEDRFTSVLDQVLKELNLTKSDLLVELLASEPEYQLSIPARIEYLMEEPLALGRAEAQMRYGFFLISLLIRHSETNEWSRELLLEQLSELVQTIDMYLENDGT